MAERSGGEMSKSVEFFERRAHVGSLAGHINEGIMKCGVLAI
jgi:hypothetical protein